MQKKEAKNWQDEEALKRYRLIAPLLDPELDEGKRRQMREETARREGISKRSLYRYEAGYRKDGFSGLRPAGREKRRTQRLPENFGEIMEQAVQLKREVPKRSVRQIIKILELEGWAAPGVLKQSTMQRHLYDAGFGVKQMKRYAEKRGRSGRRFCRPHRMELLQGDIKYGPDIRTREGKLVKTYLSTLIDDHSRYVVQSEFYDSQRQEIVEDTFHKAVLKAGRFDCAYLDNGSQYTGEHLLSACAKLGIRILHAKPGACESKGKVEKFHQRVDQSIAEIRVAHVHSVEELNLRWEVFLEQEYQKEAHEGIREYYESYGVEVPGCGITPYQEWMRDERGLVFLDVSVVAEAFRHREKRRIDGAGCFSFGGGKYEASAALAGLGAEIAYDPMDTETVMVYCRGAEPVAAHRMEIGAYVPDAPALPHGMTAAVPERSRLLDALEKKYKEDHGARAEALSFGDYVKEVSGNV
ncbi:MAG: DDE-type integrase/transposase/recombinase [Lachnospiraceae bacterium]|nr:DDE-type integrase/transposase/recombinase [Lachnospiraceae bacterium]